MSSAAALVRGGTLRALAHTGKTRLADFPDMPTFKELGHPDLVGTTWFSISGPSGLPSELVAKLNAEINRILSEPEVESKLRRAEYKRSVIEHGLDSEFVGDALLAHRKLLSWMADSLRSGPYLAGSYSSGPLGQP